jgi:glycosyltransferase involved in cell wall biosynthesis
MTKNICIVVQNYYDTDPRVRREAEALLQAGFQVDVLGLMPPSRGEKCYQMNGVQIYTLHVDKSRGGKISYLLEYLTYFLMAFFWLTKQTFWRRYDIVQVCTLPDFLVFATLIPKLFGTKIVLDMHEVMPEFYISKYQVSESSWMIRALKWQEKASMKFADRIITINEPICQLLVSRGADPEKVTIIMNSSDESLFSGVINNPGQNTDGIFRMMYHGTVTRIYGLDIAVRALSIAQESIPIAELWIIGEGPEVENLKSLSSQLLLGDKVKFIGSMPQQEIPSWLAQCTLGILPTRKDVFLDLSFSNKLTEYIIMKKPVIVSRLKAIQYYFSDKALAYFDPENENDLARKMIEIYDNISLRERLVEQADKEYLPIRWDVMKQRYINLLSSL